MADNSRKSDTSNSGNKREEVRQIHSTDWDKNHPSKKQRYSSIVSFLIKAAVVALILFVAEKIWINEQYKLMEKQQQAEAEQKEQEEEKNAIERIERLIEQEDYESAYTVLTEMEAQSGSSEDLQALLILCSSKLFQQDRIIAEDLIATGEYEQAMDYVSRMKYGTQAEKNELLAQAENAFVLSRLAEIQSEEPGENETELDYAGRKLAELNQLLDRVTDETRSTYDALEANYSGIYISHIVGLASEKEAAGDYAGALQLLQNEASQYANDPAVSEATTRIRTARLNDVLSREEAVYSESGTDGVIGMLQAAKEDMPDEIRLDEELRIWKSRKTIYPLVDIEPFYTTDSDLADGVQMSTDNQGNTYSNYICFGDNYIDNYVEYQIGDYGAYKFRATVYVTEGMSSSRPEGDSIYDGNIVGIFGDGGLLYTVSDVDQKMLPREIELDIRGVNYLKIVFYQGKRYSGRQTVALGNPSIGW
ncbi:MAG: hypothetical protein K5697_08965 [Lachnospiraceae bacterium]|nr:hypothetical protein [Lachnospiraceae bacterium]